eukprot:364510-Chlamydomonas_euryale.AAC.11
MVGRGGARVWDAVQAAVPLTESPKCAGAQARARARTIEERTRRIADVIGCARLACEVAGSGPELQACTCTCM